MTDSSSAAQFSTACYRHPKEHAGVRCQRCEKYICPDCMNIAAVGFHCPDCMKAGRQTKIFDARALFHSRPVVTEALIGMNVLAFAVGLAMGGQFDPQWISHELLNRLALSGPSIVQGEVYRLVTSGFLHIGLLHLFMNMLSLGQLGPLLERRLGPLRFSLLYLVALLGGSFGALLLSPMALTAGASGALFGLAGALLAEERRLGIEITRSSIGPMLLFNGLVTLAIPGISIGGHAGGFIFGFAAGIAIFRQARSTKRFVLASEVSVFVLGGLAIAGALWAARTLPFSQFS